MRIVFWQNQFAFHQEAHLAALTERYGCEVVWVAAESLNREMASLGWREADVEGVQRVVAPDEATIVRLLAEKPEESVHIVGGLRGYPFVDDVVPKAHARGLRYGVLQESRPVDGLKAAFRRLIFVRERLRYGSTLGFYLVMGYYGPYGGRSFYRSAGFADAKLYPYGYFGRFRPDPPAPRAEGPFRFVFVGQCIDRKGGDILLNALAMLKDAAWSLDLLGDGRRRADWTALAQRLGIADRVRFHGAKPNAGAMEVVARSDLLVLPSRFDGWGFVVNEALARGIPAVCSDRCGSSDLVREGERGETYDAFSVPDLARVLRARLEAGPPTPETRRRIWEWTRRADGEAAAGYLLECLRHAYEGGPRPTPPWTTEGPNP